MTKPEYTLVPRYRFTGDKYLLLWHTHNEQHQLMVANSREQIISMWNIALKKEGLEATAKELWKTTIVLPPESITKQYAIDCYENDLNQFKYSAENEITRYIEDKHELPPNVLKCNNFIADDNDKVHIDETRHSGCINCFYGIILTKTNWETLFENHWKPYFKRKSINTFGGFSADPEKKLYVCRLNGHYSNGISLTELNGLGCDDSQLFFFHGEKLPMPYEIIESREILAIEKEKKRRDELARIKERCDKRKAEEFDHLLNMLK